MKLPESVKEIADVIGNDAALDLIDKLPRYYGGADGKKSNRVILYVPKKLDPTHRLVAILGWQSAAKLVDAFGGEILAPANCRGVKAEQRNQEIRRLYREGVTRSDLARMLSITTRQIGNIVRAEIPHKDATAANDNSAQD